jgi:hypothetical protein
MLVHRKINLAVMSSSTDYSAKDAKRMRESRLTYIQWGDDAMSVADLYAENKKFRTYVAEWDQTNDLLHVRDTNKLERDIVQLEQLIYSIRNKIY